MPSIIAVLNSKGGSGKTTVATNLARGFQLDGHSVLIADTDPQGTASEWAELRSEDSDLPPVVGVSKSTMKDDMDDIGSAYDLVVMDGAAKLQSVSVEALKVSDVVLLPVRPSGADLWAVEELVDLIHTRREVTGGRPKAAFVVSQQIVGTNLAGEIGEILESYELPLLDGRTSQRVVYAEALSAGTTVLDAEPRGKAAAEIEQLTRDTLALLNE
jgi:chromosome partitioning protein